MINILTYNTHLFEDTVVQSEIFEDDSRRSSIIDQINKDSEKHDLICLTEVWSDKIKKTFVTKLKENYPYSYIPETSSVQIGSGLLMLSKHKLIDPKFQQFEKASNSDAFSQKGFIYTYVQLPNQAGWGLVVLAHTQSGQSKEDKSARAANLKQLLAKIQNLETKASLTIVTGDLNVIGETKSGKPTNEYSEVLEATMKKLGLSDSFQPKASQGHDQMGFTFDGTKNPLVGLFSSKEAAVSQRLDYLFTDGAVVKLDTLNSFKYRSSSKSKELDSSDHFPIAIEIEVPANSSQGGFTEITFNTGIEAGAGTDSNIFVTLHGLKGVSKEFKLQNYIDQNGHKDYFEKGEANRFMLPHQGGLGMLYGITIRSDGRFLGSDWRLVDVQVRHLEDGFLVNDQKVIVNKWIDAETLLLRLPTPSVKIVEEGKFLGSDFSTFIFGPPEFYDKSTDDEVFRKVTFSEDFRSSIVDSHDGASEDALTGIKLGKALTELGRDSDQFCSSVYKGIINEVESFTKRKFEQKLSFSGEFPIFFQEEEKRTSFKPMWLKEGTVLHIKVGPAPISVFAGYGLKLIAALPNAN